MAINLGKWWLNWCVFCEQEHFSNSADHRNMSPMAELFGLTNSIKLKQVE